MPTMFSCHDPYVVLPPRPPGKTILRNVPHISQRSDWDCGVAAVAMMCAYTRPKFYDPTVAYSAAQACLNGMFSGSTAPASAAIAVEVDDGHQAEQQTGEAPSSSPSVLNGVWTIHLVLALRRLLEAPSRHINVPQFTTSREGELVELAGQPQDEVELQTPTRSGAVEGEEPDVSPLREEMSASKIHLSFFTTCLGVNPEHAIKEYYADAFEQDRGSVEAAFFELQSASSSEVREGNIVVGLQVKQTSTRDLIEIMQEEEGGEAELIFMCLVDATKLRCRCRYPTQKTATWTESAWSLLGYSVERPFVGHYVVLCGYDEATDQVLYRNPAVEEGSVPGIGCLCAESVSAFEAARSSDGTDFDTLLLRLC